MAEENGSWIETKKEYERGELVRVVTEFQEPKSKDDRNWLTKNKDILDFIFRIIGLAAIGLPIWIFVNQQRAEANKQRALIQVGLYSELAVQLHLLSTTEVTAPNFAQTRTKIFNELYPKMILLNEKSLIDTFNIIKCLTQFADLTHEVSNFEDTVLLQLRKQLNPAINKKVKLPNSVDEVQIEERIQTHVMQFSIKAMIENAKMRLDSTHTLYYTLNRSYTEMINYLGFLVDYSDSQDAHAENTASHKVYDLSYKSPVFDNNYQIYSEQIQLYTNKLDSMMVSSSALLSTEKGFFTNLFH